MEPLLPKALFRGRPPTDRRRVINALFYIIKGGIQLRLLPTTFPPWQTVYHIFRRWTLDHTWEALNARLPAYVREACGKPSRPTAAILDSQSVKSDSHGGSVGYDAAKNIKGRKRHLLVDTLTEVLSKMILFGERSLRHCLQNFVDHFHAERNHQGKDNVILFPKPEDHIGQSSGPIQTRERLGRLLRFYWRNAA